MCSLYSSVCYVVKGVEYRGGSLICICRSCSHRTAKFEEISPKETREIAEKQEKHGEKNPSLIYLLNLLLPWQRSQKINNNTKVIARMLLILLENFMNISHREKKTRLPKAL